MQSFLSEVIQKLQQQDITLSDYLLIVPSKRAGGFLRRELAIASQKTFFAPTILSIEEFVTTISGLRPISKSTLALESYKIYSQFKEESLESYLNWAEPILNDFSEIDRHLVPQKEFFEYLSSIKLLEKWGISEQETPMIKDYISFWESIHSFYTELTESLLSQQCGYQGLIYRKAVEEIEFYLEKNQHTPHAFIGFNALNKAEQIIIQELLAHGNTQIFWDMDAHFVEDSSHSVSHFFRKYLKEWHWFQKQGAPQLERHFEQQKVFRVVEAQSDIEQVKYTGTLLQKYSEAELSKTAIVLADESLLVPLLYSLPSTLQKVNVTMGYPIKSLPAAQFFLQWLELARTAKTRLYYRDLQKVLNHPVGQYLVPEATEILTSLSEQNRTHILLEDLLEQYPNSSKDSLRHLFDLSANLPNKTLEAAISLLNKLLDQDLPLIEQLVFQKLWSLFQEIQRLQIEEELLNSNEALKLLFEMLLHSEALDMEGDAYEGLQIMGMLETRVLDFENIILLSVNEGTLPTGKSHASYLTYDLKKQFDLPMHTEKDAIYAYHFFRLLQRSSQATLLYNASSSGLSSGEKSRFLLQLEIDNLPSHALEFVSLHQKVTVPKIALKSYEKNAAILRRLEEIATKGFSPSALTSFVRNPRDFYYQRILRIQELEEVEETVAFNTLGTIVHGALEWLYKPMEGKLLTESQLKEAYLKSDAMVVSQFEEHYKLGDYRKGKNLIIFEVAKRYVQKLIAWDLQALKEGHIISLQALESKLKIPLNGLDVGFPVFLNGTVDRIDLLDGSLRIIDYKTGKVEPRFLSISNWDDLLGNYDFSKAFQVLTYAYMLNEVNPFQQAQAGILSFKSMKQGFMPFVDKNRKQAFVDAETLSHFEGYLFKLIQTICDPNQPFVEKEIKEKNW